MQASKTIYFWRLGYFHSLNYTPPLVFCQSNDYPKEKKIYQRRGCCWIPGAWWKTGKGDCNENVHNLALRWEQSPHRWLPKTPCLPRLPPRTTCAGTSVRAAWSARTSQDSQLCTRWRLPPSPWLTRRPPDHNHPPLQTGASAISHSFLSYAQGLSTLLIFLELFDL